MMSAMRSPIKIRLPFGTLKIATYLLLSSAEHDGKVPTRRFGRYYLIWRPPGQGAAAARKPPAVAERR